MAILAVLCSSFCWTISTQIFSHVGRQISIFRLNLYKSLFSFSLFVMLVLITRPDPHFYYNLWLHNPKVILFLLISGISGYALGDLFIFKSFAKMGAARTLMIQAFEPTMIAVYTYLITGLTLPSKKISGLLFLVLCLIFLSQDKKQRFPFQWTTAALAFVGISLDSFGVVMSKMAFEAAPELTSGQANVVRIAIAIPVLALLTKGAGRPLSLTGITKRQITLLFIGSAIGTFLALLLYLYAISKEQAAVIAGLGSLAPLYASTYEHIRDKIFPSKFFFLAVASMITGVILIL